MRYGIRCQATPVALPSWAIGHARLCSADLGCSGIVDAHDKTLFTIVDESMMDSMLPTSVGKMLGRTYVGHDENGKEVFKVHKNLSGASMQ